MVKNKRKLNSKTFGMIALSLMLIASLVLSLTGAWFTDSKTGTGATLKFGQIEIEVNDSTDGNGYAVAAANKTAEVAGVDIMPGDTIGVKFNVNNKYEKAHLRITLTVTGSVEDANATLAFSNQSSNMTPSGTAGIYYSSVATQSATNAYSVDVMLDGDQFKNNWQDETVIFTLKVEAIQQANFAGASAAFEYADANGVVFGAGEESQALYTRCNADGTPNAEGQYVLFGSYEQDNDLTNGKEQILWKILSEANGKATLLSEKILDRVLFYNDRDNRTIEDATVYPNNYKYSNIRAWMNGYDGTGYSVSDYTANGFLQRAFTEAEQGIIQTTEVNNGETSINTYYTDSNLYICANTTDKVYLLSYADVKNDGNLGYTDDADRIKAETDYAVAQYALPDNSSGCWWLRSPYNFGASFVSCMYNGNINAFSSVSGGAGVVPALTIEL